MEGRANQSRAVAKRLRRRAAPATPANPDRRRFAAAQWAIEPGDVLLFRSRSIIAGAGRSLYSHAAVAVRLHGLILAAESREWFGGRLTPLASQVRRRPGLIDVFFIDRRAYPQFRGDVAAYRAAELAGCDYAYWSIAWLTLYRCPLVWRLLPPPADDPPTLDPAQPKPRALFCSELVARAHAAAGLDPVPNLPHHLTEPADLARSTVYRYAFTLTP